MGANSADTTASRLTLRVDRTDDVVVVKCSGQLTADVSALLKNEVKALIPGARRIVLDLSDVTRMDSSGLGAIVGIYVSARSASCGLELINLNKQIRDLLGMTNLLSVFESCGPHLTRMP